MPDAKKVLIVEDESLTAMALGAYLRSEGYEVVGLSATGEDALERARKEHPDIIFMDIRLAGKMDGIEAAEAISREGRVSIVFMTGHTSEASMQRLEAITPAGYLTKPVDFSDIGGILARIV